jgi:hypothetical protein
MGETTIGVRDRVGGCHERSPYPPSFANRGHRAQCCNNASTLYFPGDFKIALVSSNLRPIIVFASLDDLRATAMCHSLPTRENLPSPNSDSPNGHSARPAWDGPIVRVIWGKGLGSTYQRYTRPGQPHPLPSHDNTAAQSPDRSIFSRPLTSPCCQQHLELHQPDPALPDHLLGTCLHCRTQAILVVGNNGRITATRLPDQTTVASLSCLTMTMPDMTTTMASLQSV